MIASQEYTMEPFSKGIQDLLSRGQSKEACKTVVARLEEDSDNLEIWLAVLEGLDHPSMRDWRYRQAFAKGLIGSAGWIQEESLAWDVCQVLAQAVEEDDPQSATCLWTGFVRAFPGHEDGLERLVELVLGDGDYRHAVGALEDLAEVHGARFWAAAGVIAAGVGSWERARGYFKKAGCTEERLRELLRRYSYALPEEEWPEWVKTL
jgi:hypothetical protein